MRWCKTQLQPKFTCKTPQERSPRPVCFCIYGFNIAIIAGIFSALANRAFGPQRGVVVAIVGIALYSVLAGASASVVRAAIMGTLALLGQRLGRPGAGINSLAFAVILMTVQNPFTLWDVGFQLSVAATAGLIIYAESFSAAFQRGLQRFIAQPTAERITAVIGDSFLLTLAAQVTTLPLMAYYFRSISLVSLLANLVILPPQPALMIMGGLALIGGLIALPLGQLLAWAAWPLTAYTLSFVQWFAQWPGAAIGLTDFSPLALIASYGLLIGVTWMLKRPPEQRPTSWKLLAQHVVSNTGLLALGLGVVVLWSWYFSLPESPRLKISVMDVGQGEAVLVQTPSGATALIDTGASGSVITRALARELPLFTQRLDVVIIAAPGDENIGGLPDVLARYAVGQVVLTTASSRSAAYQALLDSIRDKNIPIVSAADLPSFDLGDEVILRVLADGAAGSGVRVEMGKAAVMLPIGLRLADETALLMRGQATAATALLLADYGSKKATQENWVWALDPALVLLSIDAAAPEPDPEVLQRIAGRTFLRTDEHGTITLETDGEQLWVTTER